MLPCCGDIVWHFGLIRNELKKFVELKCEFFSFNTFDVSQIFWQQVAQPKPKQSYCIIARHNRLFKENYEVLNIIKTVKEYSHLMVIGTPGGVGVHMIFERCDDI